MSDRAMPRGAAWATALLRPASESEVLDAIGRRPSCPERDVIWHPITSGHGVMIVESRTTDSCGYCT